MSRECCVALPHGAMQFGIVVFPDHTLLLCCICWAFVLGTSFKRLYCVISSLAMLSPR